MASKVTWTWKGEAVTANTQASMKKGILKCAMLLENETKRALNKTGKSVKSSRGRIKGGIYTDKNGNQHSGMYFNADRNKWVQASPVGTPPHKQTSLLMNSITHKTSNFGLRARVGPRDRLEYGRRHELGGPKGYPARPYLGPTYRALIPRFQAILEDAATNGMRK